MRLLDDDDLRARAGRQGARTGCSNASPWRQSLDAYRNLYERLSNPELTAEPAPPPPDMVYVGRVAISRYVGRVARELTAEPSPAHDQRRRTSAARQRAYVGRVAQTEVDSAERAA